MANDDLSTLTLIDPAHLTERERRKTALGCAGVAFFGVAAAAFSLSTAMGAMVLVLVTTPLFGITFGLMYAVNRPKRLSFTRRGRLVRLLEKGVEMRAGGQLTLVACTKHLGRGRHAPAVALFYSASELTCLAEATTDVAAMQAVVDRLALLLSATVHPHILPAGTRPPERLTPAHDPGPKRGECPRCAVALDRIGGPLDEHRCGQCGGRLLGTLGTERLIEDEIGIDRAMLYDLRTEFGHRGVHCPLCTTATDALRVKGESVDLCGGCGALWLDAGELSRLSRDRYTEEGDADAP